MQVGDLVIGSRVWVHMGVDSLTARGRLAPRLQLWLALRSPAHHRAELRDVVVELAIADEVIGEGHVIAERVGAYGGSCAVEMPTTRRLLEHVTNQLGHRAAISLQLRWRGLLRLYLEEHAPPPRVVGEPAPGEWAEGALTPGVPEHTLTIARSDWYERVLRPIGADDFVYLEVAVRRDDTGPAWRAALTNLEQAEHAYTLGQDSSVFHYLRGVFDALPGAKQHIYDALAEPKRGEVDRLVKTFTDYLHSGRHVAVGGARQGEFPVDHLDAGFAIDMTKVVLSYSSRALAAARGADADR